MLRARSESLIAGGSAPAPWGPFLLFGQKKWTKEKAARSARHLLPFLAPPGARPTRRAQTTRLGLKHGLA